MRNRLLLAGLVLQGVIGFADEVTSRRATVEIRPRWRTGERFEFSVEKTRWVSSRPLRTQRLNLRATLDVLAQDAKATVLRWTWSGLRLDAATAANIDTDTLSLLAMDLPIEITLDADLSITGIRNWEAVHDRMQRTLDSLLAEVGQVLPADVQARLRAFLMARENIQNSLVNEIAGCFLPFGWHLTPNEPHAFSENVAFAGTSIPSQATLTLVDAPPEEEVVRVRYTRTFDSAGVAKAVGALVGQLAGPTASMPTDMRAELRDAAQYYLNAQSLMIEEAQWRRVTRAGDRQRVDTIRWTLKPTAQPPSSQPADAGQRPPT